MQMLQFLLENDVVIESNSTQNYMTADTMECTRGEFVVYGVNTGFVSLYRGDDFETAMRYLYGNLFEDGE